MSHTFQRFLAIGTVLMFSAAASRAADVKADTALGKVPGDAEVFVSMLRMGETVETIGNSRAFKALWSNPGVQEGWKKAKEQYEKGEGDWAPLKKFLEQQPNKELPALLADALSNEIIVYVGPEAGETLSLFSGLIGTARYAPAIRQLLEGKMEEDVKRAQTRNLLQGLTENADKLRIPDLVIGFKVADSKKVADQLKRLDPLLADALKETPLKDRVKRQKVEGDEFLVLELDGSLIPWEEVNLKEYEDKKGEFDPLVKKLKAMKLRLAVGVRAGYLLIAIAESTDRLAAFGGKGPKLIERPEFKPLADAGNKPLTAVSYTAEKLRRALAPKADDVLGFAELGKALLEKAELPADLQKAIGKDIEALAAEYAKGLKPPGATMSYSFRTPRGWETFAYDYTEPTHDTKKPLALLNHLGGDPLFANAWRSHTTVEDYREFVKWVKVFGGHAEKAILAKGPDELKENWEKFRKDFVPLLGDFSDVIEKLWIPALDGEEAFVIDAKWKSKQWFALVPTETALPLPELGLVLGVADADKLKKALEGFRGVANKWLAKVGDIFPGALPELGIPKPEVEGEKGRETAYYPIPPVGIDPQVRPTGGLTPKVAALSLSKEHTDRLLDDRPLKVDAAPLKDPKRPFESVLYLNWAGMVDVIGVWVEFGIGRVRPADPCKPNEDLKTARAVLDFLKVFRSYTSATYRDGKAMVTHSEAVFRDLVGDGKK